MMIDSYAEIKKEVELRGYSLKGMTIEQADRMAMAYEDALQEDEVTEEVIHAYLEGMFNELDI